MAAAVVPVWALASARVLVRARVCAAAAADRRGRRRGHAALAAVGPARAVGPVVPVVLPHGVNGSAAKLSEGQAIGGHEVHGNLGHRHHHHGSADDGRIAIQRSWPINDGGLAEAGIKDGVAIAEADAADRQSHAGPADARAEAKRAGRGPVADGIGIGGRDDQLSGNLGLSQAKAQQNKHPAVAPHRGRLLSLQTPCTSWRYECGSRRLSVIERGQASRKSRVSGEDGQLRVFS